MDHASKRGLRRRVHVVRWALTLPAAWVLAACGDLFGPAAPIPPNPPTPPAAVEIVGGGTGFLSDAALGFVCAGSCDAPSAASLSLVAEPAAGSVFVGWGGDCSAATGPTCTTPVNDAMRVTAAFEPTGEAQVQPSPVREACPSAGCGAGRLTSTIRLTQDGGSYRGAEIVVESSTLTPVAVTPSEALASAGCLTAVGPDKIVVVCASNAIGDGDVVDVEFERVAAGDAVLALHDAYLVDETRKVPVLGAGVLVTGAQ